MRKFSISLEEQPTTRICPGFILAASRNSFAACLVCISISVKISSGITASFTPVPCSFSISVSSFIICSVLTCRPASCIPASSFFSGTALPFMHLPMPAVTCHTAAAEAAIRQAVRPANSRYSLSSRSMGTIPQPTSSAMKIFWHPLLIIRSGISSARRAALASRLSSLSAAKSACPSLESRILRAIS